MPTYGDMMPQEYQRLIERDGTVPWADVLKRKPMAAIPRSAEKMAEEIEAKSKRSAAGKKAAQTRKAVVSEVVCGGKRYQFSASGKCVGVAE